MLLPSQIIDINKPSSSINSYKTNIIPLASSSSSSSSASSLSSSSPSTVPNSPSYTTVSTFTTLNYNDYEDSTNNEKSIHRNFYNGVNDENSFQTYYNNASRCVIPSTIRSSLFRFHPYQNSTLKQQLIEQNTVNTVNTQLNEYNGINNNTTSHPKESDYYLNQQSVIEYEHHHHQQHHHQQQQDMIQNQPLQSNSSQIPNYLFDKNDTSYYSNSNINTQNFTNMQANINTSQYNINENKIFQHFKNFQNYDLQAQVHEQQEQNNEQNMNKDLNTIFYFDYAACNNYNENVINPLNAASHLSVFNQNSNLYIQNVNQSMYTNLIVERNENKSNVENIRDNVDIENVNNKRQCVGNTIPIISNKQQKTTNSNNSNFQSYYSINKSKSKLTNSSNRQSRLSAFNLEQENLNLNTHGSSSNNINSNRKNKSKLEGNKSIKKSSTIEKINIDNNGTDVNPVNVNNSSNIDNNDNSTNIIVGPKKRVSANKKERRRTQSINNAFSDLRNRIPHVPADTKLSKIKTLKLATKYIEYLMDVLEQNDPVLLSNGFKPDLGKLRKECRSKEIRLEVERKAKGRTGWPQDVWATELKNKNHAN